MCSTLGARGSSVGAIGRQQLRSCAQQSDSSTLAGIRVVVGVRDAVWRRVSFPEAVLVVQNRSNERREAPRMTAIEDMLKLYRSDKTV